MERLGGGLLAISPWSATDPSIPRVDPREPASAASLDDGTGIVCHARFNEAREWWLELWHVRQDMTIIGEPLRIYHDGFEHGMHQLDGNRAFLWLSSWRASEPADWVNNWVLEADENGVHVVEARTNPDRTLPPASGWSTTFHHDSWKGGIVSTDTPRPGGGHYFLRVHDHNGIHLFDQHLGLTDDSYGISALDVHDDGTFYVVSDEQAFYPNPMGEWEWDGFYNKQHPSWWGVHHPHRYGWRHVQRLLKGKIGPDEPPPVEVRQITTIQHAPVGEYWTWYQNDRKDWIPTSYGAIAHCLTPWEEKPMWMLAGVDNVVDQPLIVDFDYDIEGRAAHFFFDADSDTIIKKWTPTHPAGISSNSWGYSVYANTSARTGIFVPNIYAYGPAGNERDWAFVFTWMGKDGTIEQEVFETDRELDYSYYTDAAHNKKTGITYWVSSNWDETAPSQTDYETCFYAFCFRLEPPAANLNIRDKMEHWGRIGASSLEHGRLKVHRGGTWEEETMPDNSGQPVQGVLKMWKASEEKWETQSRHVLHPG
jgi:hypothetical protein